MPSELRNTRRRSELRNKKDFSIKDVFSDLLGMGKDFDADLREKIIDYPGLDEKIRDLGEAIGLGRGEGKGFLETFVDPIVPNSGLDIALMSGGVPKPAATGVQSLAGGIPFFQRATRLAEKLGVEDAGTFAESLVALRKRVRKGENIDLGDLDDEVKELLTSGLQRVKGTNPRATGKAANTPPVPTGSDTYFRVTKSGNIVHVGPQVPQLKEGEALILQTRNGEKIVAEGSLSSRQKSTLDSTDLNSLRPQSYTKRYGSWLDEANKHFQGVKGTDVKPLGEKEGALLVEFPNPEGGKWIGTIRNGRLTSAAHTDVPLKDAKGLIDEAKPAGTDILRMVKGEESGKDIDLLKDHLYGKNPMVSGPQTPGFRKSVERWKTARNQQASKESATDAQAITNQDQVPAQRTAPDHKLAIPSDRNVQGSQKVSASSSSNTSAPTPPSGSGNLPPAGQGSGKGSSPNSPSDPPGGKTAEFVRNALGTFKTAKSILDLPVGRHAIVEALAHPITVGGPSLKAGLQATFSPRKHEETSMNVLHELGNMTNTLTDRLTDVGLPQDEALRLADKSLDKLNLSDLLQQFPSQWLEKIPVVGQAVKASERGYTSSLNTARTNRLSQMLADNPNASLEDIPGMVNMVNDFTGAGDLGRLEPVADLLAAGMFSPRLLSSRAAMLNPSNYIRDEGSNLGLLKTGTKWGDVGKKEALKDMLKFGGVVGGGLGAAALAGGNVETDPRSSDFLSPMIEDTAFDVTGGMRPIINASARLATGKTKRPWGELVNQPKGKTVTNFARSKLSPGPPSMLGDLTLGEDKYGVERDLGGNPVKETTDDVLKWLANQVSPMFPIDVAEAFQQSGPAAGTIAGLAGITGIGSQTYPRKKKEKKKASTTPRRSEDIIR